MNGKELLHHAKKMRWHEQNVVHELEDDVCPACNEYCPIEKSYIASIQLGDKRHWYSGHKYCVHITTTKAKKEYDLAQKNIDHVKLLKKHEDEVDPTALTKEEMRSRRIPFAIDIGHGQASAKGKR